MSGHRERHHLDAPVAEALNNVFDPCSMATGTPIGVLDMGLVERWTVSDEGVLDVYLGVTSPCCTLAPNIAQAVVKHLSEIPGVERVEIHFDATRAWSPELIAPDARRRLDQRRSTSVARTGTVPYALRVAKSSPP